MPRRDRENNFETEMDMRLLMDAENVERNPKRVANAKMLARQKAKELLDFAEDDESEEEEMVKKGYRKL